jgi:hypothetical protein
MLNHPYLSVLSLQIRGAKKPTFLYTTAEPI